MPEFDKKNFQGDNKFAKNFNENKSEKKFAPNDSADGNYIKKDGESKSEKKSEESNFDKLKSGLDNHAKKIKVTKTKIEAKNETLRTLDEEKGGLETKEETKEKSQKKEKEIDEEELEDKKNVNDLTPVKEGDDFDSTAQLAFIHSKKLRRGKRGKLGAMTLNPQAPIKGESIKKHSLGPTIDGKTDPTSRTELLMRFTKRNNENDQGGFSR